MSDLIALQEYRNLLLSLEKNLWKLGFFSWLGTTSSSILPYQKTSALLPLMAQFTKKHAGFIVTKNGLNNKS